jgi:glycosyltransferase involved in cell wall biosynthesis
MGWLMEDEFRATIAKLGIADRIVRPGFVPHHELPAFYCAADAFLFPSHYEGFGLPLLEALHCGCPVVTSDNSSIPEVTGDAALRCNSNDIETFAENVRRILTDNELRDELIRKGKSHDAKYSWRRCAETTLDVYKRVVA